MDKMNKEKQYTSTGLKLLSQINRLKLIKDRGEFYPINLQIAPTELCNLNCKFCSVKNRGNRVYPFDKLKQHIAMFKNLGIKSIEITGGGDPTLYPQINELISYCYMLGIKIGMITNGIDFSKLTEISLNNLTWLRISLNGLDYDKSITVPKIEGTLGFSYVWNKKSNENILKVIDEIGKNSEYIRIVPNCLNIEEQYELREEVNQLIKKKKYKNFFVQTKAYDVASPCWIGGLKPFLYTDQYVYQCSAVALYERKFSEKWRISHADDIEKVWPFNYKFPDSSMCKKGKCFYSNHNEILNTLIQGVEHDGFI